MVLFYLLSGKMIPFHKWRKCCRFVLVKKFLVLFLLSTYFFSTTELRQLLKIPVLISHYLDHKEEDDMTFVSYIVHHYGGHEKDADWETDMKLPFMQHSDLLNILVIANNNHFTLNNKIPLWSVSKITVYYQDNNIPNSYLSSIWQPPKSC
jgi:hypothetical protein